MFIVSSGSLLRNNYKTYLNYFFKQFIKLKKESKTNLDAHAVLSGFLLSLRFIGVSFILTQSP